MSFGAHLNRARRADLPLAWRFSSFRSCLVQCMWLVRQHQVLPEDWYEKQLLAFYHKQFSISIPGKATAEQADEGLLLAAIRDLEGRRNQYLVRIRAYQKHRIREKHVGCRVGSRIAWPYNGFLPDEWFLRRQVE